MHADSSISPHTPDVIFLVGAGRSGTTLLYKLLCLHPDIGFISNYENRFSWIPSGIATRLIRTRFDAKLEAWFNQGGNAYFVNRPWVKKVFPTPNEGEPVYASCGLPHTTDPDTYPDKLTEKRLEKRFYRIQRGAKAKVFLTKRTANNRRISLLHKIFPAAKFIHLIRDGRDVAQSLSQVEWWDTHTVWWDGRTPVQMEHAGEDRLTICARNWVNEMGTLRTELDKLPVESQTELRFEHLLSDPEGSVESLVDFLGLEMTDGFSAAIKSLRLSGQEAKWKSRWNEHQLARVLAEEQNILGELGYADVGASG